jgi:hypothetical protein
MDTVMEKTTLKTLGMRLRREFSTVELLPFPLQRALADLAAAEQAQKDSPQQDAADGGPQHDTKHTPSRRGGNT